MVRTVPYDFVGPLRPGTKREPAPFVGPPTRAEAEKIKKERIAKSSGGTGSSSRDAPTPTPTPTGSTSKIIKVDKIAPVMLPPPRRTIASQVQAKPKTISAYDPAKFYGKSSYRQPVTESLKQAGRKIVKGDFGGAVESSEMSEREAGDIVYYQPQFGSAQYDPISGKLVTGKTTFRESEIKKEQERKGYVAGETIKAKAEAKKAFDVTQSNINMGEDFETEKGKYDSQLADINKRYAERQKVLGTFDTNVGEKSGTTKRAISVIEGGALVAVSLTSGAGAVVAGTYLLGKGTSQSFSPTRKEKIIEAGGLFGNVQRKDGKYVEGSELYGEVKAQRTEGAVNLIFGGTGVTSGSKVIAKDVVRKAELELIKKQTPELSVGVSASGEGQSTLFVLSKRKAGDSTIETLQGFTSRGDIIGGGKAVQKVVLKGKPVSKSKFSFSGETYKATNPFLSTTEKTGKQTTNILTPLNENIQTVSSRISITKEGSKNAKTKALGSLIKPYEANGQQFYKVSSGELKGRLVSDASKDVTLKPKWLKTFKKDGFKVYVDDAIDAPGYTLKGRFKPESFGIVKEVKVSAGPSVSHPETSINTFVENLGGDSGQSSMVILGKQQSKEVVQQFKKPIVASLNVEKSLLSGTKVTGARSKTPLFSRPSAPSPYAGTGQYETIRTISRTNLRTGGSSLTSAPTALLPRERGVIQFAKLYQGGKSKTSVKSKFLTQGRAIAPATSLFTGSVVSTISKSKLKPRTIQSQISSPSPVPPSLFTFPIGARTVYNKPIPLKPIGLPRFPSASFKRPVARKIKFSRKRTKYQPSFTGLSLGIKGTGIFPGGLSVRGII